MHIFLIGLAHENKLDFKLPKNASINMIFQQGTNIFHEEIKERKLKLVYKENSIFDIYNNNSLLKKKLLI